MKSQSFSWCRVGHLLSYDWQIEKRRIAYVAIIISAIAIVYVSLSMLGAQFLETKITNALYLLTGLNSGLQVGLILWMTTWLHRKFTTTKSALIYQTLPATSWEKALTMLLEYAFMAMGGYVLMALLFYVCGGIALLIDSAIQIPTNPFIMQIFDPHYVIERLSGEEFSVLSQTHVENSQEEAMVRQILDFVTRPDIYYLGMLDGVVGVIFYMILNMCFRTHAQLKSILVYISTMVVLIGIFCYVAATEFMNAYETWNMNDNLNEKMMGDQVIAWLKTAGYALYSFPLLIAGGIYIFYLQVRSRQIKG